MLLSNTFVNKSACSYMKPKMGRPRLSQKGLAVVFAVRLAPEEARIVSAAIRSSGQTKPIWLRAALLSAARKM
jgi:hypothetical protein